MQCLYDRFSQHVIVDWVSWEATVNIQEKYQTTNRSSLLGICQWFQSTLSFIYLYFSGWILQKLLVSYVLAVLKWERNYYWIIRSFHLVLRSCLSNSVDIEHESMIISQFLLDSNPVIIHSYASLSVIIILITNIIIVISRRSKLLSSKEGLPMMILVTVNES